MRHFLFKFFPIRRIKSTNFPSCEQSLPILLNTLIPLIMISRIRVMLDIQGQYFQITPRILLFRLINIVKWGQTECWRALSRVCNNSYCIIPICLVSYTSFCTIQLRFILNQFSYNIQISLLQILFQTLNILFSIHQPLTIIPFPLSQSLTP